MGVYGIAVLGFCAAFVPVEYLAQCFDVAMTPVLSDKIKKTKIGLNIYYLKWQKLNSRTKVKCSHV